MFPLLLKVLNLNKDFDIKKEENTQGSELKAVKQKILQTVIIRSAKLDLSNFYRNHQVISDPEEDEIFYKRKRVILISIEFDRMVNQNLLIYQSC